MEDLSEFRTLPLSSLTSVSRRLLSTLLNSTKVLLTEGPIRRHRDWRGLASLVNISTEVEATIWNYNDKTGKVLELWSQSQAAMLGDLLNHLITLDRFDVFEDIIASIKEQQIIRPKNEVAIPGNIHYQIVPVDDHEIITFEDGPSHKHEYHAYVLNADEDKEFVMQMKRFLNSYGFEICTKENLLPGYASQFPPVSKLITERCKRIVLVYSPEFLQSNENSFFRDYAQADTIEKNQRRLVPIMYRQCVLPLHLRPYHMLYYTSDNFWERLLKTMESSRYLSLNGPTSAPWAPAQQNSGSHNNVSINTMQSVSGYFLPSYPLKIPPSIMPTPNNFSPTPSNATPAPSNASPTPSNTTPTPSNTTPTPSNVTPTPSNVTPTTSNGLPATSIVLPTTSNVLPTTSNGLPTTSNSLPATSNGSQAIFKSFFKRITGKKDKKKKVQTLVPA